MFKLKVKSFDSVSESFVCTLGVRQGMSPSPFLFSMYLNDIEEVFLLKGIEGIDIGTLKICLLLYADDIILFSKSAEGLQKSLDVLAEYCDRWKLLVNAKKTKILIFRKGGGLTETYHLHTMTRN